MRFSRLSVAFLIATATWAATPLYPLRDIRPGLKGIGKSVFTGDRIDDFQVEILGVLENIGPKQSLILARLSGGPLATTGVMQGMSGSPVYIDGALAGAIAMAFPYSKEPIAGIRPIEEMLAIPDIRPPSRARVSMLDTDLLAGLPKPAEAMFGSSRLAEIATPVSFSGFTRATVDHFAPRLRALGLEPIQGISGGGRTSGPLGSPSSIQPGSMISVHLVTGDLALGADGTVTLIDEGKLYAFGHRFLSVGATDLPFARAEVLTLLPSLASSFKIAASRELMGVISQDRNTAIAGEFGRRAAMIPMEISLGGRGAQAREYKMELVHDRFLSPFLLQMILFSTLDSAEHSAGTGSFAVKGEIEFQGQTPPLRLDNMYAAEGGALVQASLSTAIPLAYVMQSGFDALALRRIRLRIESSGEKRQLQIDQVHPSRLQVRPGEPVDVVISLAGENGVELPRRISYKVPVGMTPGPLHFTVGDAMSTNLGEFRLLHGVTPRTAAQAVATVNRLRSNTKAYVRVWRPDPSYQQSGADLSGPPPSLGMILARAQSQGGPVQSFSSKVAEFEVDAGGALVTGSKTIQVEIKE
ncbi:MAG: SpoIVB peptidase S55 domain-containing protein [Bryobacteraceae bacterium]